MKFFSQIAFIVRHEIRYLSRVSQVLISTAILLVVPATYCLLYISSVWQPETKTGALPVGIVNLDRGVQYKEHSLNVGWEITTRLEDSGRFGFTLYKDEQAARQLVRQGKLAFAVIIPSNFSANAVPGAEPGAGSVVIYTSQGNNYQTAAIAMHFAERLEQEVNQSLNERRWALELHSAAGSQRSVDSLHVELNSLRSYARTLRSESAKATATALALSRDLNIGLAKDVAQDDAAKAKSLVNSTKDNLLSSQRLLTEINLMSTKLPIQENVLGTTSAEGLARSVASVVEIDAPVKNSGSGFAASVVPGALWLGAAMAAFLIHIDILPRHALHFPAVAQVAGKMFLPACAALAQSILVFLTVSYLLKIHVVSPWTFAFTLAVSSMTFLCIVFTLGKAFGDMGKQMAIALLALQLSASGGLLPVELSGGIFADISPWLPLTWVVNCVKVAMFGAFSGDIQKLLLQVALAGMVSFVFCCNVGRWRFAKTSIARTAKV